MIKAQLDNLFTVVALFAGLGLFLTGRVTAQTFKTMHDFDFSDGSAPYTLILSGSTLYGTTRSGGTCEDGGYDCEAGTLFAISTDGTNFNELYAFTAGSADGSTPVDGLVLSGNTLYGATADTVFAFPTNGSVPMNLHSFSAAQFDDSDGSLTNSDGFEPEAGLVLASNILYGTASVGGTNGNGTVFSVTTDGTNFTVVHTFTATAYNDIYASTNSDGKSPYGCLILSGNILYGTTSDGGATGNGTVFAVNTDGTGFTNLYNFAALNPANFGTNSGGSSPNAGLILSGITLYGTATYGGSGGEGTVFAIQTDGTGFTNLYNFAALVSNTNGGGANPYAGLIISGNTLYGTASDGGSAGKGTVFALTTDGTHFRTLYDFSAESGSFETNSDGATPFGGLVLSGNTLYGTAEGGGSFGYGTVFSLSLEGASPHLAIVPSGTQVILTWPTNATGFTLQSSTNLSATAWTTNSPSPVVIAGQNTVTNPISGTQRFYRLSQ